MWQNIVCLKFVSIEMREKFSGSKKRKPVFDYDPSGSLACGFNT